MKRAIVLSLLLLGSAVALAEDCPTSVVDVNKIVQIDDFHICPSVNLPQIYHMLIRDLETSEKTLEVFGSSSGNYVTQDVKIISIRVHILEVRAALGRLMPVVFETR